MRINTGFSGWLVIGMLALAVRTPAAPAPRDLMAEFKTAASRIEALGGRAVGEGEWKAAAGALEQLAADAERAGQLAVAVEARVLLGRAWGELRQDSDRALAILRQTRNTYAGKGLPGIRGAYLAEAELLAKRGDADAIRRLINQFKSGADYDAKPFAYAAGEGRNTPLQIERPFQKGSDSLTVTALQRFLEQARSSAGAPIPDFTAEDAGGRAISRESLRGQVVLIDLWVNGAAISDRSRTVLAQALKRHGARGFTVVGVAQNLDAAGVQEFQRTHPEATWPQIPGAALRGWAAKLGVFGDPTNILIDRQGLIRGRNLQGADLTALIRQVVEEQP